MPRYAVPTGDGPSAQTHQSHVAVSTSSWSLSKLARASAGGALALAAAQIVDMRVTGRQGATRPFAALKPSAAIVSEARRREPRSGTPCNRHSLHWGRSRRSGRPTGDAAIRRSSAGTPPFRRDRQSGVWSIRLALALDEERLDARVDAQERDGDRHHRRPLMVRAIHPRPPILDAEAHVPRHISHRAGRRRPGPGLAATSRRPVGGVSQIPGPEGQSRRLRVRCPLTHIRSRDRPGRQEPAPPQMTSTRGRKPT